jgi:cyclopropane fatty-acyl-phospholipid synthase-like methyltransferase
MSEFERWEGRFSAPGYVFGTEPNAFLRSQAHLLQPGQKALTLADGEGRNGVWMAEQGLDVLAVDFSPTAINKARKLATERRVALRTEQADLATWTWPREEFDVAVGIFFQFATPEQRPGFFAGIKQALRPGGLLLMQNYRAEQLQYRTGGPSDIERLYTRALLQEAFGDFSALEIKEYDAVMSEGSGHAGMSALIDVVGRK